MKVFLETKLTFHECECHGSGVGNKVFTPGTMAWTVTRDGIDDPDMRKELLDTVEMLKRQGKRPVVIRMGGCFRVVDRTDIVTEEQLEARRQRTRGDT